MSDIRFRAVDVAFVGEFYSFWLSASVVIGVAGIIPTKEGGASFEIAPTCLRRARLPRRSSAMSMLIRVVYVRWIQNKAFVMHDRHFNYKAGEMAEWLKAAVC